MGLLNAQQGGHVMGHEGGRGGGVLQGTPLAHGAIHPPPWLPGLPKEVLLEEGEVYHGGLPGLIPTQPQGDEGGKGAQ